MLVKARICQRHVYLMRALAASKDPGAVLAHMGRPTRARMALTATGAKAPTHWVNYFALLRPGSCTVHG